MVTGGLAEKARPAIHRAALQVGRAVIKPADTRKRNRRRAHRTGLQRHEQIKPAKPWALPRCTGCPDHKHLRMGGRIAQFPVAIMCRRDNFTRLGVDQHRPDRHLTALRGCGGFLERQRHEPADIAIWARHKKKNLLAGLLLTDSVDYMIQSGSQASLCDREMVRIMVIGMSGTKDSLSRLIELAREVKPSAQQKEEQRCSFVYGNTGIENDVITRHMVEEQAAVRQDD